MCSEIVCDGGKTVNTYGYAKRGSVIAGFGWMFVVSLLLFWLPLFGPLIAGFVGGKRAGGVGPAILAAFLPAIVLATFFFAFATTMTGLPLIGALAGAGSFILAAAGGGPLLIGAVVGGALA